MTENTPEQLKKDLNRLLTNVAKRLEKYNIPLTAAPEQYLDLLQNSRVDIAHKLDKNAYASPELKDIDTKALSWLNAYIPVLEPQIKAVTETYRRIACRATKLANLSMDHIKDLTEEQKKIVSTAMRWKRNAENYGGCGGMSCQSGSSCAQKKYRDHQQGL